MIIILDRYNTQVGGLDLFLSIFLFGLCVSLANESAEEEVGEKKNNNKPKSNIL